jgi:hypothetical protein
MDTLEFETILKERDVIRLPEDVAARLSEGATVHVSITVEADPKQMSADEAWQRIEAFIDQHNAKATSSGKPYQWRRDDAYEHLE